MEDNKPTAALQRNEWH